MYNDRDKPIETITMKYNEYGGSSNSNSSDVFGTVFVLSCLIILIVFTIFYTATYVYDTYYCYEKVEQATILGQELIKHHGMYGSIHYEYRNTVLIGNSHSLIDSMELMTDFRPGDNITIRSIYKKYDNSLVSIEYIKR